MAREQEVQSYLSKMEILQQLTPPGGGSGFITLASIRKEFFKTPDQDAFAATQYDNFQSHWKESAEYFACILNTVRLACERDPSDANPPPEAAPFKFSLAREVVAAALADRLRAATLAQWLQRGRAIAETVGEFVWHLATHLRLWPLIVDDDGQAGNPRDVNFDHVRLRLSDWLFYFADDLKLNGSRLVSTSFNNWVPVGWSSEEAEASWTTDAAAIQAAEDSGQPVLESFSGYREFYERRNAELVAGYSLEHDGWHWRFTNGTRLVWANQPLRHADQHKTALIDDERFANAAARYFGEFKTKTSLPAKFEGARHGVCFSISLVTAPLEDGRKQLGAFAFGTILLDARRGADNTAIDLQSLTGHLWTSMNLLKLPMVRQLAREQRTEAELQRDKATLYHNKFLAIRPHIESATSIIDQLQRASSRINVHISTPKDGLFGADTAIRRIFSPSTRIDLVTLPKRIFGSHFAQYEKCGDLAESQVAMAVLAHLLSVARGAGHSHEQVRSAEGRDKKIPSYARHKKEAPELALAHEWESLWTEMEQSAFLKSICLLCAPPSTLFLTKGQFKLEGERILTSLKNAPADALMRAKRRLVKPLKEEFSREPVPVESLPLFIENCMLADTGGLSDRLKEWDPYPVLEPTTIAWTLDGEFANEWLLDFAATFCKAFGSRETQWIAEAQPHSTGRRRISVHLEHPSTQSLERLGNALRDATVTENERIFPKPLTLRTGGEGDVLEPIAVLLSRAPAQATHKNHADFYVGGDSLQLNYRSFSLAITPQGFEIAEPA